MKTLPQLALLLFLCAPIAQAAPADNLMWMLIPLSSGHKLTATSPGVLEPITAEPIQLRAARGEWENFQFVVTAGSAPIEKLEITPNGLASIGGDFIPAKNLEIYRENYVYVARPSGNRELKPKWWPDALIPQNLAPSSIEAGKSAVCWASLKIPEEAAPGDYNGEIDFLADGAPRRLAVSVTVEAARLPAPDFRGTVAVYYDALREWYSKAGTTFTDAEWLLQKKRYYDFLLDYHFNAYDLPVDWNSPEVESYLTDPRVLSVRTPPLDSPDFAVALEKFKATGTLAKAFYYWIDEPSPDRYAEVRQTTARLRPLGIRHLVTVHPNSALQDAVDIWCPNIGDFFGIGHLDTKALARERQKGRQTWVYTMVEPKSPIPTWLLDDDAAAIRDYASLWQRGGFTGFVYSMAHGWGPKPLENLESFGDTNGDGTLLYPAEIVGGTGPMPSIRLMLLRDAIEDVELQRAPAATSPPPVTATVTAPGTGLLPRGGFPTTRVSWRLDAARENLIVNFRAVKPQAGDYVAVELAPSDIEKQPEKWRFVATLKGSAVAEKWTHEGHFRYEVKGFKVTVKPLADAYAAEVRIPLTVVDEARQFRFDALRRTSVEGTKVTSYLFSPSGDPALMPVMQKKAQTVPPRQKTSKTQSNKVKPPSHAKI